MEEAKHKPGTLVYLKRSLIDGPEELLTILWDIEPDQDEEGIKYLTRTATHAKKTVFHCEIVPVGENGKGPLPIPNT